MIFWFENFFIFSTSLITFPFGRAAVPKRRFSFTPRNLFLGKFLVEISCGLLETLDSSTFSEFCSCVPKVWSDWCDVLTNRPGKVTRIFLFCVERKILFEQFW